MLFRTILLVLALAAAGLSAGTARADGLPVLGIDVGDSGVTTPQVRYVALSVRGDTLVAKVEREGGRVLDRNALRGRFTIPAVALDGSADGLSADGRTLVLIRPRVRFPRAESAFAILGAERLRVRERLTLRGDFSFDALSPDGSLLYLIEYLSPRDPTRYQVRVYDLDAGRLLPDPVVDPNESADEMRGYPLTRVTSPDGRWAYTLYDGNREHPFVHALDTTNRKAHCIDLDALVGLDLADVGLNLGAGGRTLTVLVGPEPIAVIDTSTFKVSEPGAAGLAPAPTLSEPANDGGPWPLIGTGGGLLLLGAAALALNLRRRRKLAPETPAPARS
ncbi:MAG TPA: hypothetical protein VES61_00215 [Gaiellaceae bacterium]|nr:hypothetical protein [Gaiellaceae bacterium]